MDNNASADSLSRLLYGISIAVVSAEVFARIYVFFMSKPSNYVPLAEFAPVSEILFCSLLMVAMIPWYWKRRFLSEMLQPAGLAVYNASVGLITGVVVSAVTLALPRNSFSDGINTLLLARITSPSGVLVLLIVIVLLPAAGEILFRGVLFGTLESYSNFLAALLASSLLFCYLWPVGHPIVRFGFGLVLGATYHKTRSLIAPIVAHIVLMVCGFLLVAYRFSHHL